MATVTEFFGLQKLNSGDAISTSDYAVTYSNVDTIDRVLEKHEETLFTGTPIANPASPLSCEVVINGGTIPAGRTVRYKFAWVDAFGFQTAASPEATVTTPAPLAQPAAPSINLLTTGGVLLAGNYFYGFSAYIGLTTSETTAGTVAHYTILSGSVNRLDLIFPTLPAGADGFNIYRRAPGEVAYYYLDSVDMTVVTPPTHYVDAGAVTPNYARSPSATNLTYSTNKIVLTVPGATPTVPSGYTWKVYRTFINGQYDSSLLEWVRTETAQGSGIITPETEDIGRGPTIGSPPTSSNMRGTTSRVDGAGFRNFQPLFDYTLETETLTQMLATAIPTSLVSKFEAWIVFSALAAEDFKMKFTAVDSLTSNPIPFYYSIVPDLTTDGPGKVYDGNSIVTLEGLDTATPGAPTVQAVHILGSISTVATGRAGVLHFYFAQGVTPATPYGSTLKAASWIRLET